jgi:hypothetical protein
MMAVVGSIAPSARGRAMTPEAVAEEIMNGAKPRAWILRHVPKACRVQQRTRPPLFWEALTRAWWTTGDVPEEQAS